MTDSTKPNEELLTFVRKQLLNAADALAAGNDVAPAKRFQIEALLEQILNDGNHSLIDVCGEIEACLPHGAALVVRDSAGFAQVTLQLWQRRAPVVPSTAD